MKKIFVLILAVALLAPAAVASNDDNKASSLLNSIGSALKNSQSNKSDESSTASDKDGSGSDLLSSLGSFVNNIAQNKNFSINDIVGSWEYTSPAVTFESDNALMKIGGAASASSVEDALEPYIKKLGMNKSTLDIDKDHNFTLKMGLMRLKGTINKDENDVIKFEFNAFGKVPLGSVESNITKSGKELNITFEATKLVKILSTVASKINIGTVNTLAELLNKYDGIYLGFKMQASN